jgi:predicted DNA-binding protein
MLSNSRSTPFPIIAEHINLLLSEFDPENELKHLIVYQIANIYNTHGFHTRSREIYRMARAMFPLNELDSKEFLDIQKKLQDRLHNSRNDYNQDLIETDRLNIMIQDYHRYQIRVSDAIYNRVKYHLDHHTSSTSAYDLENHINQFLQNKRISAFIIKDILNEYGKALRINQDKTVSIVNKPINTEPFIMVPQNSRAHNASQQGLNNNAITINSEIILESSSLACNIQIVNIFHFNTNNQIANTHTTAVETPILNIVNSSSSLTNNIVIPTAQVAQQPAQYIATPPNQALRTDIFDTHSSAFTRRVLNESKNPVPFGRWIRN